MKLEVGMYVRYKNYGKIEKIIEYKEYEVYGEVKVKINGFKHYKKNLLKHIEKSSHNIIDLIEVGDVLVDKEGHKYPINYEFETDYNNEYGSYEITIDDNITLFFKDDLSIVTKEQFESMSYKIN